MAQEDTTVNVETNMDLPSNKTQKIREMMTDVPVEGKRFTEKERTKIKSDYDLMLKKKKIRKELIAAEKEKRITASVKKQYSQRLSQLPQRTAQASDRFISKVAPQIITDERRLGRFAMHRGLTETYSQLPPFLRRDSTTGEPLARIRVRKPPMFGGN